MNEANQITGILETLNSIDIHPREEIETYDRKVLGNNLLINNTEWCPIVR